MENNSNKNLIMTKVTEKYNGLVIRAKKIIGIAAQWGTEVVKFQTFDSKELGASLPAAFKHRSVRIICMIAGFLIGLLGATFVVFQVFFLYTTIRSGGIW